MFFDDILQISRYTYRLSNYKSILMKKTFSYSVLFLSVFFLFSCSNNDDNSNENMDFAQLVIGEWQRTSETIDGQASSSNCATGLKITFGADGTYGESPFSGNCTNTTASGTYSINDSVIEVSTAFGSDTYEIVTLNTSSLVYNFTSASESITERTYSKL